MSYQKPELLDPSPTGDTVKDSILKTDVNVDDIYWSLNDLLSKIPGAQQPQELLDAIKTVDGPGSGLDADYLDGIDSTGFELALGDPAADGYILSSTITGVRSWIPAPSGGGDLPTWEEIIAIMAPHDGDGSTIDADMVDGIHASGFAQSGHDHNDATTSAAGFMSTADKTKLDDMSDPALLEEFIAFSTGTPDAGMPIKLDGYGVLDVSFLAIRIFNLAGDWTPTSGNEYPAPADPGDYWIIENVGDIVAGGYTFTSGFLDGKTVYDNELLVKGRDDKWGIIHMKIDPNLYYRLDGTNHLTADFQAGGKKLSNVAAGTANSDAVILSQLDLKLDKTGKAADSFLLEGLGQASFERYLGNPSANGYLLSSSTSGARNWVPAPSGGGAVWGSITGAITSQADLMAQLNGKLFVDGTAYDSDRLGGFGAVSYAKLDNNNYFSERNIRDGVDGTYGYCMWETVYSNRKCYIGQANGDSGWQSYVASFSGTPGSASSDPTYFIGELFPEDTNAFDIGSSSLKWNQIFLTTVFTEGDESKIRNISSINSIDANFLLSLSPKVFEIIPEGISGSPILADVAPADGPIHLGFVAQEVDQAIMNAGYDPDDFALTSGPAGHRSVNLLEFVPLLVKKIQDLEARVATLEAP